MADETDLRKNDDGTVLKFTLTDGGVLADLSGGTVTLKFRKKDKTTFSRPGVFLTDGSDGIVTYTSGSADFDQVGEWAVQGLITNSEGSWHTDIQKFTVGEIITVT